MQLTWHKKPAESIFDIYPVLDNYDNWIRVDIHRRENSGPRRFFEFCEDNTKIVREGIPIVRIELNATNRIRFSIMASGKKS